MEETATRREDRGRPWTSSAEIDFFHDNFENIEALRPLVVSTGDEEELYT